MQTLPRTKFRLPLPHHQLITRKALVDWLQKEAPANRLTLLSAPAGYGKTTLLAALPEALPGMPLGWLSLDNEDNDPVRFLSGLGEALNQVDTRLYAAATEQAGALAGLVGGPTVFPLRQAMVQVINSVIDLPVSEFVLVLDDLHLLTSTEIYEALDYLLDHLPPQMHIAVATRYEPPLQLNRLRARRQLAELDITSLRFDLQESRQFMNETLGLGLNEDDLRTLLRKTEGWPVGMVLLTNRLRGLSLFQERGDFLRQVERVDPTTFHYLADEVLAQQPAALQDFLLETSILTELTPGLCQSFTGQANAQALLDDLYHRNLFLIKVREKNSSEEAVYRYHALFAEFLQNELEQRNPQRLRELHARAARLEKHPGRVIAHLLAAQEWQAAVKQIETSSEEALQQGLQETVANWIAALPEDLARKSYHLMYVSGLTYLLKGDAGQAWLNLQRSLELMGEQPEINLRGQVLTSLASLAFIQADFDTSAALVKQAEPFVSGLQERIHYLMLRASLALFWKSDWQQAGADLREAWDLTRASDDMRMWYLLSVQMAPEFSVLPGALELLEEFCELASQRYGEQATPLRLGVEDTLAGIHLRRGRLGKAIETGKDALLLKDQLGGYSFLGLNSTLAVAVASTAVGNYAAAEEMLGKTLKLVQDVPLNSALTGGGLYPLGKVYWLQGRYDEARQIYQRMTALEERLPLTDVLQKVMGGLLDMSAHRYPQAEAAFSEAVRLQHHEWVSEIYVSARLLLGCLYYHWEKPSEALTQLDAVLSHCESSRTPGTILQEMPLAAPLLRLALKKGLRVRQVSALLEQMGLPLEEPDDSGTLLTARQMEILRLMAAGYSNQAIAGALVLSLATVKSHAVHIMNRLGASSRMEAVAQARVKGLL
jgi:LuxR family transcriptional regulator, maltose regulon positive regulatory protein